MAAKTNERARAGEAAQAATAGVAPVGVGAASAAVHGVATPLPGSPAGTDPELAARLRLVLNRLARHLRRQTGDDLSPSLVSALVTVELHGPLTLGDLAVHEMVTPPSVTRMVATLEQRGLVRREADVVDRRVARVSLTAGGRRALARARSRKTAYLAKRLRKLDAGERAALEQALPVLERLLEGEG